LTISMNRTYQKWRHTWGKICRHGWIQVKGKNQLPRRQNLIRALLMHESWQHNGVECGQECSNEGYTWINRQSHCKIVMSTFGKPFNTISRPHGTHYGGSYDTVVQIRVQGALFQTKGSTKYLAMI
jgi:hypothetical protein